MKKLVLLLTLLMVGMLNVSFVEAKDKPTFEISTTTIGNFQYEYVVEKNDIYINKITPLSDEGISTLKIPKKIKGKKVVRLGASRATTKDWKVPNIFGCYYIDDGEGVFLAPKDVCERAKKVKRIKIPSTVKKITSHCFYGVHNGISINIPKGVKKDVDKLPGKANWEKITISSKNKKFKVVQGCLLSKNGKTFYGFAERRKKIAIPKTVRTIRAFPRIYEGAFAIVIPKSVTKIETEGCHMGTGMTIRVAKGSEKFAVKNGCLYNKKTGHLITAYVSKDGVLRIPQGVTYVTGFLTYEAKTIIVPASVKKVKSMVNYVEPGDLTCILEGKKPFKFSFYGFSHSKKLTLYVPKGCIQAYEEEWQDMISEYPGQITIIEQE